MRIFQRLTRTDGTRRPSSLVMLAAAVLAATSALVAALTIPSKQVKP